MRVLIILVGCVFVAGSILGATHHDWGGIPFLLIGLALFWVALRRPT